MAGAGKSSLGKELAKHFDFNFIDSDKLIETIKNKPLQDILDENGIERFKKIEEAEGPKTDLKKTELLVLAIAIHNIPEGLAVGVAFGAIASGMDIGFTLGGAIALAIGMGLQNAPEGFAVSMPMRRAGFSRFKSWQWGQLSAIVEPIFAVIGAAIVILVYPILPYALAFAAGAMIFIVVEEVIPESQSGGNADIATMGLIAGFIVMMCLDVALG